MTGKTHNSIDYSVFPKIYYMAHSKYAKRIDLSKPHMWKSPLIYKNFFPKTTLKHLSQKTTYFHFCLKFNQLNPSTQEFTNIKPLSF